MATIQRVYKTMIRIAEPEEAKKMGGGCGKRYRKSIKVYQTKLKIIFEFRKILTNLGAEER